MRPPCLVGRKRRCSVRVRVFRAEIGEVGGGWKRVVKVDVIKDIDLRLDT